MNWFIKVLKQYADFKGRARRKEYWMFFLFWLIIYYALFFIPILLELPELSFLGMIFYLGTLVPLLAVGVRRMHDVGKSGWFLLIPFYSLILACTDSEQGPNKWGVNPKNPNSELDHIGVQEVE